MKLYGELVPWYDLVDPVVDHEEEALIFIDAYERLVAPPSAESLLELGAGAGHNAFFLKRRFRCTLVDLSEGMQARSRELNPECEHALGDMRTLRLGRLFDVVLIHDAIVYMCDEADLARAVATARAHLRPGGVAIFAPDAIRETFAERVNAIAEDRAGRALRGVEWAWDPDPDDDTYTVDYAFLLRDEAGVSPVHDRHIEGLFSRATWHRVIAAAGFVVHEVPRPVLDGEAAEVFVGVAVGP